MKLFVGLGNIGVKYNATRHNVGFVAVERLRKKWDAPVFAEQKKFFSLISATAGKPKRILVQPMTMMNLSGRSVAALATFYRIEPTDIWVLHDDLDFPVGTVRHAFNSRAAGHNGVQSVIDALGTKAFHRIRIGIGRPTNILPVDEFVLRKLPAADKNKIEKALDVFFDSPVFDF